MKKTLILFAAVALVMLSVSFTFAASDTEDVLVQGDVTDSITLAVNSNTATLSGTLPSIGAGSATASTTWTVTGGSASGWNLRLKTATGYAGDLCKGGTGGCAGADTHFEAFAPGAAPLYAADMDTSATEAEFGFSLTSGNYYDAFFMDNGSACNTGTNESANMCWFGLTDSDRTIATNSSPTGSGGEATVTQWKVKKGATKFLEASTGNGYYTTVTGTANTL